MANNGSSVTLAVSVTAAQVPKAADSSTVDKTSSGNILPAGKLNASSAGAQRVSQPAPTISDRPTQFRVDPTSQGRTIQQVNPDTGEVIGEFAASEFPALARSLGVPGVFVDSHA